jgi:hypothetical protein
VREGGGCWEGAAAVGGCVLLVESSHRCVVLTSHHPPPTKRDRIIAGLIAINTATVTAMEMDTRTHTGPG